MSDCDFDVEANHVALFSYKSRDTSTPPPPAFNSVLVQRTNTDEPPFGVLKT